MNAMIYEKFGDSEVLELLEISKPIPSDDEVQTILLVL
jgi:hypothetical protein